MPKKQSEKSIKEEQATLQVTNTAIGKEETRKINIRPFVTDPAHVSVKYGATVKMGAVDEYEFARVDVMLTVPCYVEEIGEVYKRTRLLVGKIVAKELKDLGGGD